MDVNKILEMLEKEDKPMVPRKREQVAKESIVRACNGSYDDINRLLEEDIAIDEKAYRQRRYSARPSKEELENKATAKECDGATPVGVDNPIPSPVMKKRADEEAGDSVDITDTFYSIIKNGKGINADMMSKISAKDGKFYIHKDFEEDFKKLNSNEAFAAEDVYNASTGRWESDKPKPGYSSSNDKDLWDRVNSRNKRDYGYEAFAAESTTEKSPMKGSTDDIVKSKPIDFKSKNNGFETDVSKETGDAKAMNEKQTIKAAGEELIETKKESVFPESFEFDEEAFAELFGLNPEEVSGTYVEEDDNIPEHVEIRFKEGENDVLLKYMDDGSIIEEVNAEVVETPRFSASMEQDDEGNFLLLISSADDIGDGTDIPKSEGEGDAMNEEGKEGTKEFVEEAGLDLDAEYSDEHGIKPAKNAADKIKDPTQLPVHESLSKGKKPGVKKVSK